MTRKRRRRGVSAFAAGVIGIVVIVVFTYLAFTKFANPFANPFTVHATFSSAGGLRPGSLVRIAGVNVGKVTGIGQVPGCDHDQPGRASCSAAEVTMTIDEQWACRCTPTRSSRSARARSWRETSSSTSARARRMRRRRPTATRSPSSRAIQPVQLDQVLTSLQADTRRNLQTLLAQYGTAVKRGGPAYNRSIPYWLPAYRYSSVVAHDALGIGPHDLSNFIAAQGTVAGALNANPQRLGSLVTDFNTTANAFARQSAALQDALAELPRTLSAAIPAFNALNASLPPLTTLAEALLPGVRSAGPAIDASTAADHAAAGTGRAERARRAGDRPCSAPLRRCRS